MTPVCVAFQCLVSVFAIRDSHDVVWVHVMNLRQGGRAVATGFFGVYGSPHVSLWLISVIISVAMTAQR